MPIPHQAGFALVEAIAGLHAASWIDPSLDGKAVTLPDFLRDEISFQAHIGYLRRDFEIYLAGMSPCLENSTCQSIAKSWTSCLTYGVLFGNPGSTVDRFP